MSPLRKTAFAAGALYLLSFVSIPTLFLYNPLRASNYILGHVSNTVIIVGATLLVAQDGAVIFGLAGQHGSITVLSFPIAIWEFSLGVYLVVKGFKPSAITALYNRPVAVEQRYLVPADAAR